MKKLRLYLKQYKNTVEMRVLEQEGIVSDLSVRVKVARTPEVFSNCIYLRGESRKYDNRIASVSLNTEEDASKCMEEVIGWLDKVFYTNNDKELKRGDEVLINLASDCKDMRYFLTDLGDDVVNGRYVTAVFFNNGKYSNIGAWSEIERIKKTGYNKETNEYYGEIE